MSRLATALLSKVLGLPKNTIKAVITLEARSLPVVDVTMLITDLDQGSLQEVQRRFVLVDDPHAVASDGGTSV